MRGVSPALEVLTREDLKRRPELLAELEVVFGGLSRAQIPEAGSLRWLQAAGAGVNGLITPALRDGPVVITNASGIHAGPIAEHMFGLLLTVVRRLAEAWDQQKTRAWRGYDFGSHLGMLEGATLGILGVGAIGGRAAEVGRAFGMRVLGLRRTGAPHPAVERMYTPGERLELLARCDVVMNVLPLTERTRHFMGRAEFAALPPGAIVCNAGRGPTIDTLALLEALRASRLGAALLDVTDPEPLPPEHPLWAMEGVYITPHYGGAHPGYNRRAGRIFVDNLRRYLSGAPLLNVVDKHEGY